MVQSEGYVKKAMERLRLRGGRLVSTAAGSKGAKRHVVRAAGALTAAAATGALFAAPVAMATTPGPSVPTKNYAATSSPGIPQAVKVVFNSPSNPVKSRLVGVTQPAHGAVYCLAPLCTYTPVSYFTGRDSFTYTLQDSNGVRTTGTITMTVTPAVTPFARLGTVKAVSGSTTQIQVLTGLADATGHPLQVISVSKPVGGTVVVGKDSQLRYTARPGFTGLEKLTFTVSNGRGGVHTGAVSIRVTKPTA